MVCLAETTLQALADGVLDGQEHLEAREHVDACPSCRERMEKHTEAKATVAEGEGRRRLKQVREKRAGGLPTRGAAIGRFLIIDVLGEGGMSVVYAAYDPELNRRVAIKLLLRDHGDKETGTDGHARLLREAQAIARLSHPNVIRVYDVGTYEGHVFLALEYIDGETVRRWVRREPRPWREVLRVLMAAGRGLAAAHAAGLVHRDFKPDNVLLGNDGRVLVTDFGLARTEAVDEVPEAPAPELGEVRRTDRTALSDRLTRVGSVIGTPGYVSPEQLKGALADARSDQFAFAVSLYEALYRVLPFPGGSFAAYEKRLAAGLGEPPAGSRVPGRVRRAVERGLSLAPQDRFASMEAMLEDLAYDPAVRRRKWLAGALIATVAAAGTVVALSRTSALLCKGAERKLAGVWDGQRKQAVREAFLKTGRPFAGSAFQAVAQRLDQHARAWTAMHTDACEATHLRGEQPEAVLTLRMTCLEQRRRELGQLVDVLADADAAVVERAVQAASALTSLSGCGNVDTLMATVTPPDDSATAAKLDGLRTELAHAKALSDAGKYKAALAVAKPVVDAARRLNYRPIEAEALYQLGEIQSYSDELAGSAESLREAVRIADAGRHDLVRARALAWLVGVVGYDLQKGNEGLAVARDAAMALERIGGDPVIEAQLESNLGRCDSLVGRYDQMLEHHSKALTLRQRLFGVEDPMTANSQQNVAVAFGDLGRYREALAAHREALAIRQKVLGPDHPMVAMSLNNIGSMLYAEGELGEGLRSTDQGLAVAERTLPPAHSLVLNLLSNRATILGALGHYDESLATRNTLIKRMEGGSGARTPRMARALANGAITRVEAGRATEEALANAERAVALATQVAGAQHDDTAFTLYARGQVLEALGRSEQALASYQRSLATYDSVLGAGSPESRRPLLGVGRLQLAAGKAEDAVATLRRALSICEQRQLSGKWLAETRFALAQALVRVGKRAEAVQLAEETRSWYASSPLTKDLKAIDAWLGSNREGQRAVKPPSP